MERPLPSDVRRLFFLRIRAGYFDYLQDIDVDLNLRSVNCGMTFID